MIIKVVVNKLVVGMIIFLFFTVGWGVAGWLSLNSSYCYYYCVDDVFQVAKNMWISVLVLGSLAFLGTSGFCIRSCLRSKQETQALEFDTTAMELATVNSGLHNTIDLTQNKLTEEDLDKEIALFEKQKKLAQLKKEVRDLERDSLQAIVVVPSGSN